MVVPHLSVLPRGSFTIDNEAESDSQIYCSSSLCLDVHDQQLDTKRRDHDDNIVCVRQSDEKEADKIGKRERKRNNNYSEDYFRFLNKEKKRY